MAGIYLLIEGRQQGPYRDEDVRQYLAEGRIPLDQLAWKEGLTDWESVEGVIDKQEIPAQQTQDEMPITPRKHRPKPSAHELSWRYLVPFFLFFLVIVDSLVMLAIYTPSIPGASMSTVDVSPLPVLTVAPSAYGVNSVVKSEEPDTNATIPNSGTLEERDWNEATGTNTQQSYESFCKSHSDSQRAKVIAGTIYGHIVVKQTNDAGVEALFKISANSGDPVIEIREMEAIRLGFIPVESDGEYTFDYDNNYVFEDAKCIAVQHKDGLYKTLHFSYSRKSVLTTI